MHSFFFKVLVDFRTHIRMYFQIPGKGKRTTINMILLIGPVAIEVLQQVEQHIIQLGTDLAHCSVVGRPRFFFCCLRQHLVCFSGTASQLWFRGLFRIAPPWAHGWYGAYLPVTWGALIVGRFRFSIRKMGNKMSAWSMHTAWCMGQIQANQSSSQSPQIQMIATLVKSRWL